MEYKKNNPDAGFPTSEQLKEFLARETNATEKTKFIERIRNNEPVDLAGEGLQKYLQKNDYNLESLGEWIHHFKPSSGKIRSIHNTNSYFKAAAAILILGIAIGVVLKNQNEATKWKQYYVTDPGLPIEMGSKPIQEISAWIYQYRTENYESALNQLKNLVSNDTIHFYRASCYFELGETGECITELGAMRSTLQGRSVLLKAFCYWRMGDEKMAKLTFRELCFSENSIASRTACFILTDAFQNES
jgi:hypothetical protein